MNQRSTLIFGGNSPIALSIANNLNLPNKKAILVTRDINAFNRDLINPGVELVKLDMQNLDEHKVQETIISQSVDSLVFMHRYIQKNENILNRFQVEVHGPQKVIELFIKYSQKSDFKPVVFGGSPAARVIQTKQSIGYHMSKAAQISMMKYLATNHGNEGFRFNTVSPGAYIEKERSRDYYRQNPELVESIEKLIPVGRFGKVTDISNLVNFLLSEKSSFINGATIEIDGGVSAIDPSAL